MKYVETASFCVLLGTLSALSGCSARVLSKEEIRQYEIHTELDEAVIGDLFDFVYEPDEYSEDDPPRYGLRLYLADGYIADEDFSLEAYGQLAEWNKKDYSFEEKDGRLTLLFFPVYENEEIVFTGLSGHLISYQIPEKYLRKDEYGRYFYLEHTVNRCYLDGRMAQEKEGGKTEMIRYFRWPLILKNENQQ